MRRGVKQITAVFAAGAMAASLAACGSDGSSDNGSSGEEGSELGVGPIDIWYSTNEQEIEWGEAVVEQWNADHPDEQVDAKPIPAGSSSEDVITASISAGNTACLVYNTAPSAVPMFQQQAGLVNLSQTFPDADDFIAERSGDAAEGFKSSDGDFYQMPWKTNPFMLYYNKDVMSAAGLDSDNPAIETYDDMLALGAAVQENDAADYLIYPPSTADFTNVNFDFYPSSSRTPAAHSWFLMVVLPSQVPKGLKHSNSGRSYMQTATRHPKHTLAICGLGRSLMEWQP